MFLMASLICVFATIVIFWLQIFEFFAYLVRSYGLGWPETGAIDFNRTFY